MRYRIIDAGASFAKGRLTTLCGESAHILWEELWHAHAFQAFQWDHDQTLLDDHLRPAPLDPSQSGSEHISIDAVRLKRKDLRHQKCRSGHLQQARFC